MGGLNPFRGLSGGLFGRGRGRGRGRGSGFCNKDVFLVHLTTKNQA